jgi:hypothetical protein
MQHVAAAAWSPASDRKIYILWIGVIWAAILAGFGLDFARYLSEGPPPPSSSGAVRRSRALDRRDHHDHSQLFANMARRDGSAGQCLGGYAG